MRHAWRDRIRNEILRSYEQIRGQNGRRQADEKRKRVPCSPPKRWKNCCWTHTSEKASLKKTEIYERRRKTR